MSDQLILIHIYGLDKPKLTARLTSILAEYDVDILDMGQAVIHQNLSLGILIRIPPESESAPIIKELLFAAHDMDVNIKFSPVDQDAHEAWVKAEGKERHIVTLLGPKITSRQVAVMSKVLAENDLNIDVITRLTGRTSLDEGVLNRPACVEFSLRGTPRDTGAIHREFLNISAEMGVDIAMQADNAFRRNRRLVVFDMDSTLIQVEVVDELAKEAGVGDQVSAITASAMRGEIDFKESLRRRLNLLSGLDEAALDAVADRIPLTSGAERLIANLKRYGYKIAIISGGFTYFGRKLQDQLGIDYLYANELEIVDGVITGKVLGDIVDAERKAFLLKDIARREDISLQQVIAVGDGANDLPMLNLAGLGIAFHAKPKVKAGARQAISTLGLDSILYLIGMRDRDLVN
ncbi:MAG: phosphoserine phosphatase SerB [Desulfovibrio sp.]|uniref:phosphoserine phosphatase SerB n=1 Tax=Desulfovibrio sp. 7SRBS1 TaxID=3378064 RepID=UPI003B404CE8